MQPTKTVAEMVRADERLKRDFPQFKLPLLIIHGTKDTVTRPEGSQEFYDRAGSTDKTLKLYEGYFHDPLNDIGKEAVMADIRALDRGKRLPALDVLLERLDPLDRVLETHAVELGDDFTAYRNHAYRVVNLCVALAPCGDAALEKVALAAAFHDLGIWTARTFDYLAPSIDLACAHLACCGPRRLARQCRRHDPRASQGPAFRGDRRRDGRAISGAPTGSSVARRVVIRLAARAAARDLRALAERRISQAPGATHLDAKPAHIR